LNPIKIAGGIIVLLGFVFRAISIAYFNLKLKTLPDTPAARRRHAFKKRNALVIDALFVAAGFYVILRG
jgi:hypothetical protein